MKWNMKGHEFDNIANKLIDVFHHKRKKIYIFGAGVFGAEIKILMEKVNCFVGFIDNDVRKQREGIAGVRVISLQKFITSGAEGLVIIAADAKNTPVMEAQLCEAGLKKEKDYFLYREFKERFFPILSVYEFDWLYMDSVQISLTERCSLKCRKCAHACYAVDAKSDDMSIEKVIESIKYFFERVDFVKDFILLGGEPFLYKAIAVIVEYIGKNYRDRMDKFIIITNGTIIPCQNVCDMCRRYKVTIHISNYSTTLKYLEKKYNELQKFLENNQVSYVLGEKEHQWMDYGFETVNRNWQKDDLIKVFDACKTPCREVRGSRLYYCVMARSVSENLQMGVGENDYLDLKRLGYESKKILLEFQLGYSEKGYLDMCNFCHGAEAINYPIPAAEQK